MLKLLKPLGLTVGFALSTLFGVAALAEAVTSAGSEVFDSSSLSISISEQLDRIEPQLLAQQQQPRTALVIGNADYGVDDYLEGPDNDARAMYEKLQDLGFDVPPPLINGTKQEMEAALRDFSSRMSPDGVNVFYYSGHSVQIDGQNYLLPVDLDWSRSEVSVRYDAVPLNYVVANMFSVIHELNLLIIDASRNSPFYLRWGSPNLGLDHTRPPRGTVIAYATEPNKVTVDNTESENSLFTASLLKYLEVPNLSFFEVFSRVAREVETQTNGDQIPSLEGSPRNGFINPFALTAAPPTSTVQLPKPDPQPLPPAQILAQEPRTALVIGNAAYSEDRLENPTNDATDIAASLSSLGFEVTLMLDKDLRTIEDALDTFSQKLQQGGVGVFYYAGHGVQVNGESYLVPLNARLARQKDVRYDALPLGKVLNAMESSEARVSVLIIDACRDNPFIRRWRSEGRTTSVERGLVFPVPPEGTIISFATGPGEIAVDGDGDGRNSPYTASLLQHIDTEGADINSVFRAVRADVMNATERRQIPWYQESLTGFFSFNPTLTN